MAMYLDDIKCQLNYTVSQGSKDLDTKIDDRMSDYTDMNSTDLNDNGRESKNFLENTQLYIPFGMAMNLSSQPAADGDYTWREDVRLGATRGRLSGGAGVHGPETGYQNGTG